MKTLLLLLTISLGASAAPSGPYSVPLKDLDGNETTLAPYKGRALLIVNTASRCGFTPQYEGLEALYQKYRARGLTVLGFPSNDFLNQEPGTNAEIRTFCRTRYGVTFPLFAKAPVSGPGRQPLFTYLTGAAPETGPVKWNFEKFVVAADGRVTARFRSDVKPDATEVTRAIEAALPRESKGVDSTPAPAGTSLAQPVR